MPKKTGPVEKSERTARAISASNKELSNVEKSSGSIHATPPIKFVCEPEKVLRPIPVTASPLDPKTPEQVNIFKQSRIASITHLYAALDILKTKIPILRPLPSILIGTLLDPDGFTAAKYLKINVHGYNAPYCAYTDSSGKFELHQPYFFKNSDNIILGIQGYGDTDTINVNIDNILPTGFIGEHNLNKTIKPLPISVIQSLKELFLDEQPKDADVSSEAAILPELTLGEDGQVRFVSNQSVNKYPYSVFFRLVEPRTNIVTSVTRHPGEGNRHFPITKWTGGDIGEGTTEYVDRIAVEQPLNVDGFRNSLAGFDGSGYVTDDETVPMAGTLGLGYIVQMAQKWMPKGLILGDMVYSLPLAPGEQQRVAVFERLDTAMERESELLTVEEQERLDQVSDNSTQAVATSAFKENASGGSDFFTAATSASASATCIVASGSSGFTASGGSTQSWLEGSRDLVQRASEDAHSATNRQASARRSAVRMSMRLATASESENVTTKVITNHNHTRALTLQYWEVQRLFEISSDVEGVNLVCMVPLKVIRFLLSKQSSTLTKVTMPADRQAVLERYSSILKHADVLAKSLPREYQYGLTLLKQFASDPTAEPEPVGGAAEDIIEINLTGAFLHIEEICVSAVTRRGTRLGPIRLTGVSGDDLAASQIPQAGDILRALTNPGDLAKLFSTKDSLIGKLRSLRMRSAFSNVSGRLIIPPSLARNDIIGFELSRRFQSFDYDLINPEIQMASLPSLSLLPSVSIPTGAKLIHSTVHLSPQELEKELGGPLLGNFRAALVTNTNNPAETFANAPMDGVMFPPSFLPIPAVQIAPVLRYSQLLDIEKMLQHVVRNTVNYSKAIWLSLTPEERAIMLEGFTIGVSPGGINDNTSMVPLLNCVENRVLGFFGNSMIMPFNIPPGIKKENSQDDFTSADVQSVLMRFHKTQFIPKKSMVALPTRGVLGEAVLGSCPSAENIDLRRFWNWADSPADSATEIASVTLPTTQPSITPTATQSALTGMAPLINNINATPATGGLDTALLQAMVGKTNTADFNTSLTNSAQLSDLIKNSQNTAETARADALKTTQLLNAQAMATAGNILGGMYANDSKAGSNAANAVYGKGGGDSSSSAKDNSTDKNTDKSTKGTQPKDTSADKSTDKSDDNSKKDDNKGKTIDTDTNNNPK